MKNKLTTKLFSLSCENHPTLLARIVQTFTRPGYGIETLSQSRTDVSDIVLITLEVAIPAAHVDNMILRLKRIIGVLEVTISFGAVIQSAIYTFQIDHCPPSLWDKLNLYRTQVLSLQQGQLLIQQVGQEGAIDRLYQGMDGPGLIAFSRHPVAISQPLNWEGYETFAEITTGLSFSQPLKST